MARAGLWLEAALRARLGPAAATSRLAPHAPRAALGSVCLLFALSPWVGTGMNAALVVLAALWVVAWRLVAPPRLTGAWLDVAVLTFAAVHLVATGFSPYLAASLKGLAKMLIYWAAYVTFRHVLADRAAVRVVLFALLGTAAMESTYGVYQWVVGVEPLANWEDPETLNPLTRVYGSLMNPNLLAGYLLPVFPLAVAVGLTQRGALRLVGLAASGLAPIAIFFTYSRGAYLGLAASLAVLAALGLSLAWPTLRRRRDLLAGLGALAVGGLAALVWRVVSHQALQDRITSIFTLRGHSSNSFRVNVWHGVVQMVQDNWAFGVGIGNTAFRKMYSLYMVSGYEALGAYNVFLEVLAEMGVLGLAAFGWLLGVLVLLAWRTFRRGDQEARWLSAGILAALAGTFVMGLVDTVFYRPAVQLQFWWLLALAITVAQSPAPASTAPAEGAPT
ncbi:MAG: O-antigen ligase family protein [Candidatus Sericytochromatia bacterium]|nr:O-antigen ligase family protein [Candidatus Sericytochromatia bacterium]